MDNLNQTAAGTALPTIITRAFAEWTALQAEILSGLDADMLCQAAYDRNWAVESFAISLPAFMAQDVWALVDGRTSPQSPP